MAIVFGIDVSKATSSVAVINGDIPVWQSVLKSDWFGFQELLKHLQDYREPQIVFEATGVYSQRLKRFLDRYTQLNPLAAKKQLDGLRTRKTDKNDALHR